LGKLKKPPRSDKAPTFKVSRRVMPSQQRRGLPNRVIMLAPSGVYLMPEEPSLDSSTLRSNRKACTCFSLPTREGVQWPLVMEFFRYPQIQHRVIRWQRHSPGDLLFEKRAQRHCRPAAPGSAEPIRRQGHALRFWAPLALSWATRFPWARFALHA